MSAARSRKRKRADRNVDSHDSAAHDKLISDVCATFKEDYHEAIEQLPLALHRQYSLMSELDSQSQVYVSHLLSIVKTYLHQRRDAQRGQSGERVANQDVSKPPPALMTPVQRAFQREPLGTPRTPTVVIGLPPNRATVPGTGREMLSRIGWLVEELTKTGEEKVNLSQAAYDSVQRQIRILDQAIKEQEFAIHFGAIPGSHALPELVLPRNLKSDTAAPQHTSVIVSGDVVPTPSRKGKKASRASKRVESQTLTITLPATTTEEQFCLCRQGNFGEMVACDNPKCDIEWFHLECVSLKEPPGNDTKWYCPMCAADVGKKRRR